MSFCAVLIVHTIQSVIDHTSSRMGSADLISAASVFDPHQYRLGSSLSRVYQVYRRHSDLLELIFIPGNVSMQVEQVGI